MAIEKDITELKPGDELAEDIKDSNGQLLMPAGKILDEKLIQSLKRRDIKVVTIKLVEQLTDEDRQALRLKIIDEVDYKFRNITDNALMQEFHKMIIEYRTKDL